MSGVCIGCVFLGYPSSGGGAAGVSSFAGRTGAVVPEAGDYAAFYEPIGESAAAVAAHASAADPHAPYYLTDGSKIITGNLALDATNIVGAATIAAAVAVNAPLHSGVALTATGSGGLYLADDGTYKTTPDSNLFALQYSDTGIRGLNAALQSGGDLFGNLTAGSGIGQPTIAGRIRAVSWRRTNTSNAGSLRVSVIDTAQTERVFTLVPVAAAVSNGITSGLDIECFDNEQVAVIWDGSSGGTTTSPAASVFVEPS